MPDVEKLFNVEQRTERMQSPASKHCAWAETQLKQRAEMMMKDRILPYFLRLVSAASEEIGSDTRVYLPTW